MELETIRWEIDHIDGEIICLLAKRSNLVSRAVAFKGNEQAVRDPKRVEQVIEKVRAKAVSAGLSRPRSRKEFTGRSSIVSSIKR